MAAALLLRSPAPDGPEGMDCSAYNGLGGQGACRGCEQKQKSKRV
jgi:hypothetical protein